MDVLGMIFLALIVIVVLAIAIIGLRSIPDLRRYKRIRDM